eukprot:CAMPEP_0201519536 /NCGR_PEP_ID=MMETSP0161_2-20130828/10061_1 /ASSEMBLY_ACC=CAM_ASM_000251 /TAXON_ID=180227 /ORGANISM="Neoparamoeba aestuarina, Strain SoJaBio B1-5/56/2" /LENGTH=266 /DNA_ID=CAMNT_0047917599 /DNA_START=201 /DNA_END=1001 /DNA_ORIENTATION=+
MELDKDLNLTIPQKTRILEKIRTDLQGRNSFKMFLAKEFAEENLLFVEAVEKFDDSPADERYDQGFKIYETFVKSGSPKEVNVEAAVRKNLNQKFEASEIKKFMFKDAFDGVLATLRDDNLMRYMKSPAYEKFIEKLKEEKETNMKGTKQGGITPLAKGKKSPGGTPSASPGAGKGTPTSDGDILELMFQVYEDVKEASHADLLQEHEKGSDLGGVTDFEMFLLQDGGGSPAPVKEKKEKKPKEGGKKPSFWQRMTDEQKRKKGDS